MARIEKDPDNKTYHTIDWSGFLASDETITASTWVMDSGLVEEVETTFNATAETTTIVFSGGIAGRDYGMTNRITYSKTADPNANDLTQDKTVFVRVKNL